MNDLENNDAVACLVAAVQQGMFEFVARNSENDKRPFLKCTINRVPLDLLFDSGSQISCLRTDVFEHIKTKGSGEVLEITQATTTAIGANGMPLKVHGTVTVHLRCAGQMISQKFTIVDHLPVAGLLGLDAITTLGIGFHPRSSRILGPREALVRNAHSVEIPPNQVEAISVTFCPPDGHKDDVFVVEGIDGFGAGVRDADDDGVDWLWWW